MEMTTMKNAFTRLGIHNDISKVYFWYQQQKQPASNVEKEDKDDTKWHMFLMLWSFNWVYENW